MTAPPSQKADVRPISFVLIDQAAGGSTSVDLVIRPEELTRTDTSRLTVQQTLDGAWADNFGPGIPMLNLSGHTGWRAGPSGGDGESRFHDLKANIFDEWHRRRNDAVKAGQDPDLVQLRYADSLDKFTEVVAPQSFVLRRSKSWPLLMQFQISLYVLKPDDGKQDIEDLISKISSGDLASLSFDSIGSSIASITRMANQAKSFIDQNILAPVQSFMRQSAAVFQSVQGAIKSVAGVAQSLIAVARSVAQVGVNVFRTIAAIANFPNQVRGMVMQVVSAYTNIFCLLSNAIKSPLTYADYGSLYGASGCSSTAGGRPVSTFAGSNPFYSISPTVQTLPVNVSPAARVSIPLLQNMDPVFAPMAPISMAPHLTNIATGVMVA